MENVEFSDVALKMESLRDFGTSGVTGRPMKVEMLKSIESLEGIRLEDWVEMSSGLMPNSHLHELHIDVPMIESMDGMVSRGRASLQTMTNLVKLHLKFDMIGLPYPHTLNKLIPNLESLTSLKLIRRGYSDETLVATVFPPNLSHLTLVRLTNVSMEELGKLPKLHYLTLKYVRVSENIERMEILHDGFPCLEALSLKKMFRLRAIDIEEGGMSCLNKLRIRDCPLLKSTENLPKHMIISFA